MTEREGVARLPQDSTKKGSAWPASGDQGHRLHCTPAGIPGL